MPTRSPASDCQRDDGILRAYEAGTRLRSRSRLLRRGARRGRGASRAPACSCPGRSLGGVRLGETAAEVRARARPRLRRLPRLRDARRGTSPTAASRSRASPSSSRAAASPPCTRSGSPPGWRAPSGLQLGAVEAQVTALAGPLIPLVVLGATTRSSRRRAARERRTTSSTESSGASACCSRTRTRAGDRARGRRRQPRPRPRTASRTGRRCSRPARSTAWPEHPCT